MHDSRVSGPVAPAYYSLCRTSRSIAWGGNLPGVFDHPGTDLPHSIEDWLDCIHPNDRELFRSARCCGDGAIVATCVDYRVSRGRDGYIFLRDEAVVLSNGVLTATLWPITAILSARSAHSSGFSIDCESVGQQQALDLKRFFELSIDLFCIAKLDGYFLRVNSNFTRLLGYDEESLLAQPFLAFVHPDDRPATESEVAKLAQGLPVIRFRNRYRDACGGYHHLEWTARAIPEEELIFAVARDVTEQVAVEAELQTRSDREQTILDHTQAVIYVKNSDGAYLFVNRRFTELFSLAREQVVGKTDYDIFPEEMAQAFRCNDEKVVLEGKTFTVQEVAPHADGNHTYISVKFPLKDSRGKIHSIAGISTDITNEIRANESKRQLELAQFFQQKLYPKATPEIPGLDVTGVALPVSELCGDYFDFIPRSRDSWVLVVGDVCGHGVGPALAMVEVRTTLRLLLGRSAVPLGYAVEELNAILIDDLPESSFISLFLAEIDVSEKTLRYIGAGHMALLLGCDGSVLTLDSNGPLLGHDNHALFDASPPIKLAENDQVLIFTDGIVEAEDAAGERFGMSRLLRAMRKHRSLSSESAVQALIAAVHEFTNDEPVRDDMTAILAKVLS
ncbi:MAG: SpoIIE family protein phosphatase [Planctomycetales bacterium]|nr:SpoIIE family protein phosphatase [Planctomycetales bacterium]